jgi:sulfite oxidase
MISWDLHVTSSAHRIKVYSVNRSRSETAARLKFLDEHGLTFEPLTRPIEASLETEEDYLESVRKYPREPLF